MSTRPSLTSSSRSSSPIASASMCSGSASIIGRITRCSAPAVALAAAAARTKRIRLTSAVTVLSSDDPVRVYQQFATLDLISGGRAEIMAGRGSFIESFPLFGYDLNDYDELFAEKLDLLLQIRAEPKVTGKAGIARRSRARASTRARCNSRCRSGSPPAARRNRSRAPARSACRWRSRSSAASRRDLRRSRSSIARPAAAPASRPTSSWSASMAMASSPTRPKPRSTRSSRLTPR